MKEADFEAEFFFFTKTKNLAFQLCFPCYGIFPTRNALKLTFVFFQFQLLAPAICYKSVNLRYITVGRLDDDMIVPPSDGPMFILIDWEYN